MATVYCATARSPSADLISGNSPRDHTKLATREEIHVFPAYVFTTRHKDGSISTFFKYRNVLVVEEPTAAARMQARAITLITSAISAALGSKAVPVSIAAAAIVLARNIRSKRLSPASAAVCILHNALAIAHTSNEGASSGNIASLDAQAPHRTASPVRRERPSASGHHRRKRPDSRSGAWLYCAAKREMAPVTPSEQNKKEISNSHWAY